jgi:hypothetical protein
MLRPIVRPPCGEAQHLRVALNAYIDRDVIFCMVALKGLVFVKAIGKGNGGLERRAYSLYSRVIRLTIVLEPTMHPPLTQDSAQYGTLNKSRGCSLMPFFVWKQISSKAYI